jgi:hypothetical protein
MKGDAGPRARRAVTRQATSGDCLLVGQRGGEDNAGAGMG